MLVYEKFSVNGKPFIKAYSTSGFYIRYENIEYVEVIFPADEKHIFIQTRKEIKHIADDRWLDRWKLKIFIENQLRAKQLICDKVTKDNSFFEGYKTAMNDVIDYLDKLIKKSE